MSDFLSERRQALENRFFAAKNAELLENLRREAEKEGQIAALSDAAGISDAELLSQLVDLDIQAETLASLSLVPLLWVAWADRRIDDRARSRSRRRRRAGNRRGFDGQSAAAIMAQRGIA